MVKKILPFLTLLFVIVMVVAIIMIVGEVNDRQQEIDNFNELADLITNVTVPDESEDVTEPKNSEAESDEETQATEPQAPAPVFTRNLAPLFEKNADCIGWVYIEGMDIDYPVMHTPAEPQRYLHLNFDKAYSNAGVPFLDGGCTLDCDHIIIYGHNMKNGTMFADITQYRNQEHRDAHPVIEFETEQGLKCFTVFAVVQINNTDGWYDFHTAADENEYNEQVAGIQSRALYDTGITPEYGQQLLTLSTCYRTNKSDRLVVIGVETPYQ